MAVDAQLARVLVGEAPADVVVAAQVVDLRRPLRGAEAGVEAHRSGTPGSPRSGKS